jgi:hypothetical protein
MTRNLSSTHRTDDTHWAALQQALTEEPDRLDLLDAYQQLAVELDKADAAQAFLDRLQRTHRWNHAIRRARIALCLHQKNHDAAMAAVETLVAFSRPDDDLIAAALAIRAQLGPRRIDPRAEKTSISLCMIVRDEQAFLGPCLNSVKNLVDEIIVVDTGSKDRSADIATIYGAQVHHERWQDNFALARNISLEKAMGDWILILDADEVIAQQDFSILRRMISSNGKTAPAFSLQTRNYINLANAMDLQANDGRYPQQEAGIGWFPTNKVRLFRNNEVIRFDYPVHELVEPSLHAVGLKVEQCAVPIHHYGHINEAKNIKKAKHYFALGTCHSGRSIGKMA